MENDYKRIIEINGIKIEVDLRTAKRIDEFKVGDCVKLLVKEYSDSFKSYPGAIVGFDEFKNRPTIIVAYIKNGYSEAKLEFAYINKDTQNYEISAAQDFETKLSYSEIQNNFEKQIKDIETNLEKKKTEIEWFNKHYKMFFGNKFGDFGSEIGQK